LLLLFIYPIPVFFRDFQWILKKSGTIWGKSPSFLCMLSFPCRYIYCFFTINHIPFHPLTDDSAGIILLHPVNEEAAASVFSLLPTPSVGSGAENLI
jgi:hypothetical protein